MPSTVSDEATKASSEFLSELEEMKPESTISTQLKALARSVIDLSGEDAGRPGLLQTPERFSDAIQFLTKGYKETVEEVVGEGIFDIEQDQRGLIVVRDVAFSSLCEHHLLPFNGSCHVAYYPGAKVLGLSKIARIVEVYSRRFQIQERLTYQIAEGISKVIDAEGVAVILSATHLCMTMRGVEQHNSKTTTSAYIGNFKNDASLKSELFSHLNNRQ